MMSYTESVSVRNMRKYVSTQWISKVCSAVWILSSRAKWRWDGGGSGGKDRQNLTGEAAPTWVVFV